jgi:hypothetical protein
MSETTDQELSSFIVVARIANYSGQAVWRKLLALTADLVTHLRWVPLPASEYRKCADWSSSCAMGHPPPKERYVA